MGRGLSGLVAAALVIAACGSSTTDEGEGEVGLGRLSTESSESLTDVGDQSTAGGDEAEMGGTQSPDAGADSRSPREVRTDPVPTGATFEQTEDVIRSIFGPTEDFATQGLRIDPVFPSLPTPPDSEIVKLRFSGTASAFEDDGPTTSRTSLTIHTSTAYEDVTALFLDTMARDHSDWEEIQGRSSRCERDPLLCGSLEPLWEVMGRFGS